MGPGKVGLKTLLCAVAAVAVVDFSSRLPLFSVSCWYTRLMIARAIQAVAVLAVVLLSQHSFEYIGISRRSFAGGIAAGIRWAVVFGGAVSFAGAAVTAAGLDARLFFSASFPRAPYCRLIYIATGTVVAPVFEELLFRGVVYGFFRRYGIETGIVVSTLVFALLHAQTAGALPVVQLIGGVLFCLAYEKEKNLFAPMVIHSLGNTAIFALAMLR